MHIKFFPIIIVALLATSAFAMFQVVYEAKNAYKDLHELQRQYVEEKKTHHVLQAEWSYLNQPGRLKVMAEKYLDTGEVQVAQLQTIESDFAISIALNEQKVVPSFKPVLSQLQGE